MRRGLVLAASVWSLAMPVSSGAQAVDTLRLTLATALDIAEGNNPAYRQARNITELNAAEMRATWFDQLLPRASLSLFSTGFTGNLQRIGVDPLGNPIANPSAEWNYFSNTSQSLNLSWNIQGRSLVQDHRRQTLTNQGREVAEERALTDLQFAVQRLYVDALEQRDLTRVERELVDARNIDLDVAERMFSLALRTRVDVLNAELAVEQQELALRQQQAAFDRARLALRTQLGRDESVPISLADEPLPLFDPSGLDADALVENGLRVNPEIRQSRVTVRSSSLGVSQANNAWWPSISMGLEVYRRAQRRNTASLFEVGIDEPLDSRFYMQFSIPMFNNYFQNRLSQEQASVQLENDREAARETRLRIEETVRGALLELENQWESLRLVERSLAIAEEALRLAREEYRIGTRSFEDLRSSFEQEAGARRQVITGRHAFVDALLSLEEAVGARVRPGATPIGSGVS